MSARLTAWELDNIRMLDARIATSLPDQGAAAFACEVVRVVAHPNDLEDPEGETPERVAMYMALLAHAYALGLFSSRRVAVAAEQRLDFIAITAAEPIHFKTLVALRERLEQALTRVLARFIAVCDKAGYFPADDHPARMAAQWVESARAADAEEDGLYGEAHLGMGAAPWLMDPKARERRLRAAIEVLTDPNRAAESEEDKRPLIRAHSRNSTEIIAAYPEDGERWEPEPALEPEPEPEPEPAPPPKRAATRKKASTRSPRGGAAATMVPESDEEPPAAPPSGASTGAAAAVEIIRQVKSAEDRLRLVEVALSAAISDGEVTPQEQRRVQALVRFLRFDDASKARLVKLMRSGQSPPLPTADDVPDYDVRVLIFEHAAAMALVDGRPNERELAFLKEVALNFELAQGDVKAAIARAQTGG